MAWRRRNTPIMELPLGIQLQCMSQRHDTSNADSFDGAALNMSVIPVSYLTLTPIANGP